MKKRVVIAALWLYAVWNTAAVVAYTFGYADLVGPIAGAIAATFVATRLPRAKHSMLEDPQDDGGRASIGNAAGQEVS